MRYQTAPRPDHSPIYSFDAKDDLLLECKKQFRRRNLRSLDLTDALALTFAQPVAPRERGPQVPQFCKGLDYDPYAGVI